MEKDYYAILQVARKAEQIVIDAAYRRLAQKYHPDVSKDPNSAEMMRLLNEAYAILGEPQRRAQYDRVLPGVQEWVQDNSALLITEKGIVIGKNVLALPCSLEECSKLLGVHTRVVAAKANTIYVWDELGILAYVPPGKEIITNIKIAIGQTDLKYWPNHRYAYSIRVGNRDLSLNSEIRDLQAAGFFRSSAILNIFWECRLSEVVVYGEVDETTRKIISLEVAARQKHVEGDLAVALAKNSIAIGGANITLPCSLYAFSSIVGKPNRMSSKFNNIHTWDLIGIMAYEPPGGGFINAIRIAFADENFDFWPKRYYAYPIRIGGHVLSANSGAKDLRAAGFVNLRSIFWQCRLGPLELNLHTDQRTQKITSFEVGV